ncbi:dihydrolipoyllysine-residue acetyltransferase [Caballeronia novacaledonica]|nr:dihydrolipoyllysine-residue acetyltransferase [Caballeronia novacaledonica]
MGARSLLAPRRFAVSKMDLNIPFVTANERVRVVEVLVAPGDEVASEEALITVENEKAVFDVNSIRAGIVKSINVNAGDVVATGMQLICFDDEEPLSRDSTPTPKGLVEIAVNSAYLSVNEEATLAELPLTAGDYVEANEVIAAVQSDKAILDIHSPVSGTLAAFVKRIGDKVVNGAPLAILRTVHFQYQPDKEHSSSPAYDRPSNTPTAPEEVEYERAPDRAHSHPEGQHYTPSERARLRRNQPLPTKSGVGEANARSTASASEFKVLPWPKVDFAKFGSVEQKPLSRIKKISGANLHRNWVMIPHVTNNDEADITELEELRVKLNKEHEKAGVKFTMLAFVIKAVVSALKKFPDFNASLDGDNLVFKQYYHIGFAADTPNGLVVPVIRDANKKGLVDIAKEMAELSKLARDGKLKPDQMQGGCFSISSLGGIGGTHFTPIINAPEVAILGLSRGYQKPVWDGKQFAPRLTLPMSLSYDHRVIDGAAAARFNAYLSAILGDFRRVIL